MFKQILRNMRLVSLLLVCSCAQDLHTQRAQTVDDVVARESELVGKPITVTGYLRFGDDSRNLWSNRQVYLRVTNEDTQPDDPAWMRCITLYDIDGFREKLVAHNNDYVLVSGVVQRVDRQEGEITTSSCNELGISVRSLTPR